MKRLVHWAGQPNPQKGQGTNLVWEKGWHDNKSQQERKVFSPLPAQLFFLTVCCHKLASIKKNFFAVGNKIPIYMSPA